MNAFAFLYERACVCLCKRERESEREREREREKEEKYVCDLNFSSRKQTESHRGVCMLSALRSETLRPGTLRTHNREKDVRVRLRACTKVTSYYNKYH